jgi:uncharacterized protein YndB with AHSA1/START domain
MTRRVLGIVVAVGLCAAERIDAQESASASRAVEPNVVEAIVKAPPVEIWRVFATAEGFKKLGVAQCEMDFRVGGLIKTHYDPRGTIGDEGTIHNEILSYEPGRMVSIRIHKPPKGFPFREETWKGTWSVITLTDLGDGRTNVRITGMGYTDTDESRKMRDFFRTGNRWVMAALKKQFDASEAGPKGPPHPPSSLATIVHERVIELPKAEVWSLISTSAGWKKFFDVDANIELTPGGRWEILFGKDAPAGKRGSEGCVVLSYLPERMLSYTWNAPPKLAHAREKRTWVVVELSDVAAARTSVRLEHLGFEEQAAANPEHAKEWEEARAYFDQAWPKVLDALKAQEGKKARSN